jgi:hypothetical protein
MTKTLREQKRDLEEALAGLLAVTSETGPRNYLLNGLKGQGLTRGQAKRRLAEMEDYCRALLEASQSLTEDQLK